MPRLEKQIMVDELKNSLAEADNFIIAGYSGLSSNELNDLRRNLRREGGILTVVKNRLASIAMQEGPWCQFLEHIDGPTAFVLIPGDPVRATKVLAGFAKGKSALELRGGLVQSIVVKEKEIMSIARLPGRELLLAQFVSSLASPVAAFINVISGPISSLIRSLNAIREKIGGEDDAKEKGKRSSS